jgi:hypothetical protein
MEADDPNQQNMAEDIFDEYGGITSSLNSETRTTSTFATLVLHNICGLIFFGLIFFVAHAGFLSFRFSR